MATKKETAIKSAVTREKNKGKLREEKHILWFLVAIIAILLYWLLAQHNGWWPFTRIQLGSAFYTNVAAGTPGSSDSNDSSDDGDSSDDNGTGGGSNNGGSGGGNGGGSSTTSDSILDLAAGLNVGDSKAKVSGKARNLGSGCAVLVNAEAQTAGKQEVCTYSQGDKIVTVTYLNNRVISASKSGF